MSGATAVLVLQSAASTESKRTLLGKRNKERCRIARNICSYHLPVHNPSQLMRPYHHRCNNGMIEYCGAAQPALNARRKPVLHSLAQWPAVHMLQKTRMMQRKFSSTPKSWRRTLSFHVAHEKGNQNKYCVWLSGGGKRRLPLHHVRVQTR